MIAINLLRRTLANEQYRRRRCLIELSVGLVLVVGMAGVSALMWWDLDRSISTLHRQEAQVAATLREVGQVQSQLETVNRQVADLQDQFRRVTHLTLQHRQTIHLLDVVSRSLDPLRLWLSGLDMEQNQVTLQGFSESKDQIVQFAQFLKQDDLFQRVTVREASRVSGDSSTYQFIMDLLLTSEVEYGQAS